MCVYIYIYKERKKEWDESETSDRLLSMRNKANLICLINDGFSTELNIIVGSF